MYRVQSVVLPRRRVITGNPDFAHHPVRVYARRGGGIITPRDTGGVGGTGDKFEL